MQAKGTNMGRVSTFGKLRSCHVVIWPLHWTTHRTGSQSEPQGFHECPHEMGPRVAFLLWNGQDSHEKPPREHPRGLDFPCLLNSPSRTPHETSHEGVHSKDPRVDGRGSPVLFSPVLFFGPHWVLVKSAQRVPPQPTMCAPRRTHGVFQSFPLNSVSPVFSAQVNLETVGSHEHQEGSSTCRGIKEPNARVER